MTKRHKITVRGLLESAAVLLIAFTTLTAINGLHQYLELFSHFRLQYLAASVILLFAFAVLKEQRFALLMGFACIFNAIFVLPWYFGDTGVTRDSAPQLTLMYANVLAGNDQADRLIGEIEVHNPDIVILQEVTSTWAKAIEPLRTKYPHHTTVARDDAFGIAVLSKQELTDLRVDASPPRGFPSVTLSLELDETPLTIISTHTMPPLGRANYEARNQQLAEIGRQAADIDGNVIVIGDLNTSMWAHNYRKFEQTTGLRNAQRGFGIHPTWPLFLPIAMIPIDHCLVSPDLVVLDFGTGARFGSDHLPILVTIGLAGIIREEIKQKP